MLRSQPLMNLMVILTAGMFLILPGSPASAIPPASSDCDEGKGPKAADMDDAVLSKGQKKIVLELAAKRGIKEVAEISTFVMHPSRYRGIHVKGVEQIKDREVSTQILRVHFKDWSPPRQAPRKDDIRIGDFWAGKPFTRKETILKVGTKEYRASSVRGLSIEQSEAVLARLMEGKYTLGSEVQRDGLKEIDWSRPLNFSKSDAGIAVSFLHKAGEGSGFFELDIKPSGEDLTVQQVLQAVP